MKILYSKDIIDPETEVHFAIHKTFQKITESHSHDFYEIVIVTNGKLLHTINGVSQLLKDGDLLFIRPTDQHYYKKYNNNPVQLINLAFTQSTIENLLSFLGEGYRKERLIDSLLPPIQHLNRKAIEDIKLKCQACTTIPPNLKDVFKTHLRSLLAELMINYFSTIENRVTDPIPEWLSQIELAMQQKENFKEGLPKLYELSLKSPEHVSRMIKKHFKKTPTQWINDFRLSYASNLLIYTDEPILDIILETGFENTSHFYHLFQKKFKLSPGKYRNKYSKNVIPD